MGQQIESALVQSIHRIVLVGARLLPGVLAFLLALLVFLLLGLAVAALLRYMLRGARFDERLAAGEASGAQAHLADLSPARSPSLLVARIAFWVCVLSGFLVGSVAFDASYSADSHIASVFIPYFARIAAAVLLLIAGNLIARFLARSILIGAVNAHLQYARFLSLGVKWLVLVLTAAMALDHLQIGGRIVELAFGILFAGIVLTLSLAVGLGLAILSRGQ